MFLPKDYLVRFRKRLKQVPARKYNFLKNSADPELLNVTASLSDKVGVGNCLTGLTLVFWPVLRAQ